MLGPHPPYEKHSPGPAGPIHGVLTPERTTVWQVLAGLVSVAAMTLGCLGFAAVADSARYCDEMSRTACLSLMVDNLTGKAPPPSD